MRRLQGTSQANLLERAAVGEGLFGDNAFLAQVVGELHTRSGIEHRTRRIEGRHPVCLCRCRLAPS